MFDRSEQSTTKMIHLIVGLYQAMNVNAVAYPELTADATTYRLGWIEKRLEDELEAHE